MSIWRAFSFQATFAGVLAAFVGSASSFAIILSGLQAVGATPSQAATGLMAAFITMGVAGVITAVFSKMPIGIAWSTPGAALLGASAVPSGGFPVVVGAFLICAGLLVAAGLFRPFGRMVERIPKSLANALIAGVLVQLCFAPFLAVEHYPLVAGAILLVWALVGQLARLWAVPAALATFLVLLFVIVERQEGAGSVALFAPLVLVGPKFTLEGALGIALPLFVITMAGQNIPGIAVMKANDYAIKAGPWFSLTGVFSALGAPFGGVPVNLAAITAAMMAGESCHGDPQRRYWAAIAAGLCYVIFGVFTGGIVALVSLAPLILVQAVAGLALIPAFMNSAANAFEAEDTRLASAIVFLFGASGVSLLGISGAFWGLLAGLLVFWLSRRGRASRGSVT